VSAFGAGRVRGALLSARGPRSSSALGKRSRSVSADAANGFSKKARTSESSSEWVSSVYRDTRVAVEPWMGY